jgi:peptide/nickel transport system ATP-binding protein
MNHSDRHQGTRQDTEIRESLGAVEVDNLIIDFPIDAALLNRRYLRAVNRVSFKLVAGRALAIVGESGSGKSTCARALTRLYKPTSGTLRLDGLDINDPVQGLSRIELAKQIQMIFQDPFSSLNPIHTVGHHLTRPLRLHSQELAESELRAKIHETLSRVGLSPPELVFNKYPHELSGGQRQRLAIARAISTGARFILADEPISMLDVSIRLGILNLMADMKSDGIGFLYITHDIATARYFAEETAVMYVGHMVEWGDSDCVTQSPRHPYTQLLIDAVPEVGRSRRNKAVSRGKSQIPLWTADSLGCPFADRCPLVQGRCRSEMPPVTKISDNHFARCFALGDTEQAGTTHAE